MIALRPDASSDRSAATSNASGSTTPRPTIAIGSWDIAGGWAFRPAGVSCTRTCAFSPPMPNAETAAVRDAPRGCHGSGRVSTRTGNAFQSTRLLGCSNPTDGAFSPRCIASSVLTSPIRPAASSVWPRFDFADPIGSGSVRPDSATSWPTPSSSVASPSDVLVAWHSSRSMSSGPAPGRSARRIASVWPSFRGAQSERPRPSDDSPSDVSTP